MTEATTDQTAACAHCQHPQHLPGVECDGIVNHNGDRRWHRCLCLNQRGHADSPCHPLMTCQGGKLGYADIWYLQRGHTLQSTDGPVTPDVLRSARPFRDEPTEVLTTALDLANNHAAQAARFQPDAPGQLPAVVDLFRTELQHRGEL